MRDFSVTSVELGRAAKVNRETVTDAAEERRQVRVETIDKLKSAMDLIRSRRESIGDDPSGDRLDRAAVVTSDQPDYHRIVNLLEAGMVVAICGTEVRVYRTERTQ
jgi:hypothetical protein